MKAMLLICGFATLVTAPSILAAPIQLNFVEQMSKQIEYAEQQAVWPGFHPGLIPSIFLLGADKEWNAYAINFNPVDLSWINLSSQLTPIYYLKDISELQLDPEHDGNTVKTVDNQQSYIDVRESNHIEIEENMFNKYMMNRFDYFLKHEANIDSVHYDFTQMTYNRFNDPYLIKLAYLEDAALTRAQQVNDDNSKKAIQDAVAISQYRNQLLSPEELYFENHNAYFNGLPYFIGWTTREFSDVDYSQMIQRTGCYPLNSLASPDMLTDCTMRGLPALASAAYGKILDKRANYPLWKNQAITQFKSVPQMIIDDFHLTDEEAKQIAQLAMENPDYHWARISKIVDHTMLPYLHSMNEAIQEHQHMPGITVHRAFEWGYIILYLKMFIDDVYAQSFVVNNKTLLLSDLNLEAKVDDNPDNDIIFDHLPYMSIHFEFDKLELDLNKSHTDFKLNNDAIVIIDNVTTSVAELIRQKQKKSFNQLRIIDSNIKSSIMNPGFIDASDGSITIKETTKESNLKSLFNFQNYYQFKWNLDHSHEKENKNIIKQLFGRT